MGCSCASTRVSLPLLSMFAVAKDMCIRLLNIHSCRNRLGGRHFPFSQPDVLGCVDLHDARKNLQHGALVLVVPQEEALYTSLQTPSPLDSMLRELFCDFVPPNLVLGGQQRLTRDPGRRELQLPQPHFDGREVRDRVHWQLDVYGHAAKVFYITTGTTVLCLWPLRRGAEPAPTGLQRQLTRPPAHPRRSRTEWRPSCRADPSRTSRRSCAACSGRGSCTSTRCRCARRRQRGQDTASGSRSPA